MMALTPKRLFLYLCISISLLRPYTLFSRSPLVNKTLFENACELEWVVLYFKGISLWKYNTTKDDFLAGFWSLPTLFFFFFFADTSRLADAVVDLEFVGRLAFVRWKVYTLRVLLQDIDEEQSCSLVNERAPPSCFTDEERTRCGAKNHR